MDQQEQDQRDADMAAFHADMTAIEQEAGRVIAKAMREPITQDEVAVLRWACGIAN